MYEVKGLGNGGSWTSTVDSLTPFLGGGTIAVHRPRKRLGGINSVPGLRYSALVRLKTMNDSGKSRTEIIEALRLTAQDKGAWGEDFAGRLICGPASGPEGETR